MDNKIFIGVDVSEGTLEVAFLRSDGTPVRTNQTFPNTPEGHSDVKGAVYVFRKFCTFYIKN